MPVDFARAVAFIREHGDELDNNRLDWLSGEGTALSGEQERHFYAGQRADGGWPPYWAPEYSSLDATCFRMARGEGLAPGLNPVPFERAIEFLRSRQRADGSWEEDDSVRELAPPWAVPGELAPRLYLTANCGWWLANARLTSFVTSDEAAMHAGAYLERHLAQDGSLPSFLQAHWLAAGLWIRLGRNDLANRTLDHLATRIDESVPAGALGWMLTTFSGLGISEHPLIQKAAAQLMAQQRADGSWASEDGSDRDPYVTVEALRGLIVHAAI